MTEDRYARVIFLEATTICDAHGSLALQLWQNAGGDRPPFTFRLGLDEWDLSVREAGALARATSLIERTIATAEGGEPRPRLVLHVAVPFSFGPQILEMGVAAEPGYFFFAWAGTTIIPGPTKRDEVFTGFARMGAMASQMPDDGGGRSSRLAGAGMRAGINPATYRNPYVAAYLARPLPWEHS